MTEKEIAKEILIKLIDVKAIGLYQTSITESVDKISVANEENLKTVCNAYATIFNFVEDGGAKHNRDVNAAINIRNEGKRIINVP